MRKHLTMMLLASSVGCSFNDTLPNSDVERPPQPFRPQSDSSNQRHLQSDTKLRAFHRAVEPAVVAVEVENKVMRPQFGGGLPRIPNFFGGMLKIANLGSTNRSRRR